MKIEDIKKEVSWDLKIAPNVNVSERPTVSEVELIRTMDPADIVLRVKRTYEKLDFFEWADAVEAGWEKVKNRMVPDVA